MIRNGTETNRMHQITYLALKINIKSKITLESCKFTGFRNVVIYNCQMPHPFYAECF